MAKNSCRQCRTDEEADCVSFLQAGPLEATNRSDSALGWQVRRVAAAQGASPVCIQQHLRSGRNLCNGLNLCNGQEGHT